MTIRWLFSDRPRGSTCLGEDGTAHVGAVQGRESPPPNDRAQTLAKRGNAGPRELTLDASRKRRAFAARRFVYIAQPLKFGKIIRQYFSEVARSKTSWFGFNRHLRYSVRQA